MLSGADLTSFSINNRTNFFGEKKKWKGSFPGCLFWRTRTKTLNQISYSYSSSSSKLKLSLRPGLETISQQHAAHTQQRSYWIHAQSFSSTPKSSKRRKGCAGRMVAYESFDSILLRTFSTRDERVNDNLRSIKEVSKLCFPDDKVIWVFNTHAIFKTKAGFFRQRTVDNLV